MQLVKKISDYADRKQFSNVIFEKVTYSAACTSTISYLVKQKEAKAVISKAQIVTVVKTWKPAELFGLKFIIISFSFVQLNHSGISMVGF